LFKGRLNKESGILFRPSYHSSRRAFWISAVFPLPLN